MQPNHDDDTWQKPPAQPSEAPYAVPSENPSIAPVVSMTPDEDEASRTPEPSREYNDTTFEPIRWQAKEYVHHEKNVVWFIIFGCIIVVLIALAIFVLDSISFAVLVPVMAAALLVYINRPPRLLDYTIGRKGFHINDQLYSFAEFKGFGIIHDGEEYSVMLIPIKRFRPGIVVYFPEEAGEAIVDALGARLPMLELSLDLVDRLIRKLRI